MLWALMESAAFAIAFLTANVNGYSVAATRIHRRGQANSASRQEPRKFGMSLALLPQRDLTGRDIRGRDIRGKRDWLSFRRFRRWMRNAIIAALRRYSRGEEETKKRSVDGRRAPEMPAFYPSISPIRDHRWKLRENQSCGSFVTDPRKTGSASPERSLERESA